MRDKMPYCWGFIDKDKECTIHGFVTKLPYQVFTALVTVGTVWYQSKGVLDNEYVRAYWTEVWQHTKQVNGVPKGYWASNEVLLILLHVQVITQSPTCELRILSATPEQISQLQDTQEIILSEEQILAPPSVSIVCITCIGNSSSSVITFFSFLALFFLCLLSPLFPSFQFFPCSLLFPWCHFLSGTLSLLLLFLFSNLLDLMLSSLPYLKLLPVNWDTQYLVCNYWKYKDSILSQIIQT